MSLVFISRSPRRFISYLIFERGLLEGPRDVPQREAAYGAAGNAVLGGVKHGVEGVLGADDRRGRLDLCKESGHENEYFHSALLFVLFLTVEVEGPLAWDGAVEPRLEERRPLVSEFVRAARVVFAHAGHAGEDGLREEEEGWIFARAH